MAETTDLLARENSLRDQVERAHLMAREETFGGPAGPGRADRHRKILAGVLSADAALRDFRARRPHSLVA